MKRKTIRKHNDFIVPRDCIMARCFVCTIKTKPAKIPGGARYGLVVSKKIFGLSTQRNHAKRLLRDWIAFNENLMRNDTDYIFIANNNLFDCDREQGRTEIKNALQKILKLYEK